MEGIEIKALCFEYKSGFSLHIPHLEFEMGKVYSLIGPNGAGKSTLFKLIIKSLRHYRGEINVFGRGLKSISIRDLHNIIGYCGSEKILNTNFTVHEFVSMGYFTNTGIFGLLNKKQKEWIQYLLYKFNLYELREHYLFELSSGEMKRARICKSLVNLPRVIIIDEPEEHLDLYHTHLVFENIKEIYKGRYDEVSFIFSTHNINLASKFSEEMLILKSGNILYKGKTQDGITEENIREIYNYSGQVIVWKDMKKRFVF